MLFLFSFQLFILTLLILHAASTENDSSHGVIGAYRDLKFDDYELDLWTFVVKSNSIISSSEFHISSRRHEAVKAFLCCNQKHVDFLPDQVEQNFPNLAIFDARNCSIKSVGSGNFQGLRKLVKLQLDGNQIEELNGDIFSDLVRLKFLSVTHNKIHNIHEKCFGNLRAVQSLYLGHNNLKHLHKSVFENLENLRNLSLHYNHLTTLNDEHLMNNRELEYIWLEHNDMSHLSYTMFNYMDNLKFIDFTFNLHMWSGFVYEKKSGSD